MTKRRGPYRNRPRIRRSRIQNGFGTQVVRTYVLSPATYLRDAEADVVADPTAVLDGDLDMLLKARMLARAMRRDR